MEPGANEWHLVIKVKFGDTLRRFSTYVHGRVMDHSISEIRAKIVSLFKFNPNADLILTYTDEDGDAVVLDDDDDLYDAVINQRLNPLRINIQLNTRGSSDPKTQTISSTPTGSRQFETGPPQIGSAVGQELNSAPKLFHVALSKLSQDLLLKAASSATASNESVECLSEFVLSNATLPSHGAVGESSGISNTASTSLMDLRVSDKPKVLSDLVPGTIVSATISSGNPVPEHIPKQNGSVNITQGLGVTAPTFVDTKLDPLKNSHSLEFPFINDLPSCTWTTNYNVDLLKEGVDTCPFGKSDISASLSAPPVDQTVGHNPQNFETTNPYAIPNHTFGVAEVSGDDNSEQFPISATPSHVQTSQFDVYDKTNVRAPEVMLSFPTHRYRTQSYHDTKHHTSHRGVRCAGCEMDPIMGPRFKSNLKVDYDLCRSCFSEVGNEADYTKIEQTPYRPPRLFKEFYDHHSRHEMPPSRPFHGCGMRTSSLKIECPSRAKLESSFVQDITVEDGTVMPPCTPFTKIWRMCNNGTVKWPFGTQFVWTGGDPLANRGSAPLEVPMIGFPVGEEIDITVDFSAPSTSGSYISYWSMASPSGQMFGDKVWVQIEVENSQPNSAADGFHGAINLNMPPESSDRNGIRIIETNTEPLDGGSTKPVSNALLESLVNAMLSTDVEPVVADGLLGAGNQHVQLMPGVVPSDQYPINDFTESPTNAAPVADTLQSTAAVVDNPVEQILLKELEEMGFKQIDLNKEVLRVNKYDLQQSVDVLCGFAE